MYDETILISIGYDHRAASRKAPALVVRGSVYSHCSTTMVSWSADSSSERPSLVSAILPAGLDKTGETACTDI